MHLIAPSANRESSYFIAFEAGMSCLRDVAKPGLMSGKKLTLLPSKVTLPFTFASRRIFLGPWIKVGGSKQVWAAQLVWVWDSGFCGQV